MRLFIDSANIEEIREVSRWGVLSGVTTNPSLVAKEGREMEEVIKEITSLVSGPISAEVLATEAPGMVEEGRKAAAWGDNVVIKIPMTEEGLRATYELCQEGIEVNMTLVFSTNQALLAAQAGASFISPFIGRLDDIGHSGLEVVRDVAELFAYYAIPTEVIAASIRHPLHVVESAQAGADIATVPYKILKAMVKHPLTDSGLEKFLSDWKSRR